MITDSGKYYLYRHIRLDTNQVFYIGIGTKKRNTNNKSSYERSHAKKGRNSIWQKIVAKTDYKVQILLESDNYEFIKEKEIEFIALYGRKNLGKGELSNLTNGGDGVTNIIVSKETRNKISKSSLGRTSPNKGKKWDDAFKQKISNSLKGNKISKESIEKRINTLKNKAKERGFYQHKEWKENIGKANSKTVYVIIDNKIINFPSCHKAADDLNMSFQMISYACKRFPKLYKNMHFSYNKEDLKQFTQN